ncbi:transferrin-like isoform X2 [Anthonomus grandis grandis]|uniref:transferrin-like isoform X2 n=1 Tax=Anthonomus grandis grandis TaxID=2921223 RepID=UPI002165D6DC|nr:transferrin-like isoform X2 [Anthonomus grandis grandis]
MFQNLYPIYLLLFTNYFQLGLGGQLHKLCLDTPIYDACQQIERDQELNCQTVVSKTDCIIDADQGLPTLTALTAEEAYLAAGIANNSATVIAEIVGVHRPYQTVVIVKSGYLGGFEPLRGYKYCHPGYDHDEKISKLVLEQLDWKAINLACNSSQPLIEQKFEALANTFGSSCRPGKWTEDLQLDAKLKNKYSSLCQLCGTDGCSTKYTSPLNDSLTCLTENGGDVALTALSYAETFFSIGANAQNYQYLCPNGTLATSANPCTWTSQLHRLIITSSASMSVMTTYLNSKLPSYVINGTGTSSSIEPHLARLLNLRNRDQINIISPTLLNTYVSARRSVATYEENVKCNLSLKWSVTDNLEFNKCLWLQQASLSSGIQPVISCIKSSDNSTVSNLNNIKNGDADLAFADANFGYIARKKNLTNVAYPETVSKQLSKIVIVVKNNTTWYNGTKSLEGKRICLPEYGGKEWLAFIDLLRKNKVVQDSCNYAQIFSAFVGESCAPGANAAENELDIPDTDYQKLCKNCYPSNLTTTAAYCNADANNKYYDSLGALKCLEEANGDYAVIAINDLPHYIIENTTYQEQFKVICKNESLAAYNGFNVDEEAPITIIVAGEVVAKNGSSKLNDIISYLNEVEIVFGQKLEKSFKVFDSFNHTKNLLFPDSTPGLTFGETTNKYIENYVTLLRNSENCNVGNNTSGTNQIVIPSLFIGLMYITARLF